LVRRGKDLAFLEPFPAAFREANGVVTRPFRPRLTYEVARGIMPDALQTTAMAEVVQITNKAFEPVLSG
jgi:hypothetical protein